MKKINYVVLMAAMLLIGTKSWAVTEVSVSDETGFENAWKTSGDVKITLTGNVELTKMMWLGTVNINDASRKIEIDLNGYNLLSSSSVQYSFLLTHGTLKISNSRPASGQVQGTYTKYKKDGVTFDGSANLFYVTGSTNKNVDPSEDGANYFTHLEIGEGVVVTQEHYDALITVAELNVGSVGQKAYTADKCCPKKDALTYITNVYAGATTATGKSQTVYNDDLVGTKDAYGNVYKAINTNASKCVAHGVRVDLKGKIAGTKYGIKTNGNLGSPGWYAEHHQQPGNVVAYDSKGLLPAGYTIQATDVNYSPYVYIHPTGKITVWNAAPANITKNPIGVYASGYSRWKVEGYAEGCNGAVIKSGQVDFTDATVIGTGPVYEEATASNSGTTSSGSGIVVASTDAYSGEIEVSIGGDTEISSQNGYALEEVITAKDGESDVQVVDITGGSFEGSTDQGSIKITNETVENGSVAVTGGQIVGGNPSDEGVVSIGGMSLTDFIETAVDEGKQDATHVTVTTDENGDKVMVIVTGETPKQKETIADYPNQAVNWRWTGIKEDPMEEEITADLKLDQLQINQDYDQTVTIKTGKTLEVGSVILGEHAKIIVEPGATFIVTKKDGIYAPKSSNLILQTQSGNPSIFLFNPAVTTNAHPHATVDLYSNGYKVSETTYTWQRFGVPTYKESITFSAIGKSYSEPYKTQFQKIVDGDFVAVPVANWGTEKLVPFTAYSVSTTYPSAGSVYTFVCDQLVGNGDVALPLSGKWNFYANSYTAPISISHLISDFNSKYPNMSGTVYLYKSSDDKWYEINNATPYIHSDYPSEISPMDAFAVHRRSAGDNPVINYANDVYNPLLAGLSPAPARSGVASLASAVVEIVAADGTKDEVCLLEGEQFSAEFDNTYDAEKMMNEEKSYIYGNGMNEKLGILATDNLEGTKLSMNTKEQTSFIMTVRRAEGMNYAIRDMLTGTEVELTEDATYMFSVPANTTIEGRFQIVGLHKLPTAIDAVAETAATKGIYNMAGQYMGNDYHSLPAGVYVVDGKKVVK